MTSGTALSDGSLLPLLQELWDQDASAEGIAQFFEAHPSDMRVDAWLLDKLMPLTSKGQRYLRTARAAHAYVREAQHHHLLVAWPIVPMSPLSGVSWKFARGEAQHGLSVALAELDAHVQMCAQPLSCEALHVQGATRLTTWVEALRSRRDPLRALYAGDTLTEAGVWVGCVSVPVEHADALENLFFSVGADISHLTRALAMRMEALLEEEGAQVRVFLPTAIWNAASLARLARARLLLAPLKKAKGAYSVQRESQLLRVSGAQGDVFTGHFPEETAEDLAPLFSGWATPPLVLL